MHMFTSSRKQNLTSATHSGDIFLYGLKTAKSTREGNGRQNDCGACKKERGEGSRLHRKKRVRQKVRSQPQGPADRRRDAQGASGARALLQGDAQARLLTSVHQLRRDSMPASRSV